MTKKPPKDGCQETERRDLVRYVYGILLSSNAAFVVAFALLVFVRTRRSARPSFFVDLLGGIAFGINDFLHLAHRDNFGVDAAFVVLWIAATLLLLLLLRLLQRTVGSSAVFHPVAAILGLAAVPGSWLYINKLFWPPREGAISAWYLFALEVVALCGLLVLFRTSAIPIWCSSLFLILHYSLWAWVVWPRFTWDLSPAPIVSLVGPCFGFVWALYVSRPRRSSTETP